MLTVVAIASALVVAGLAVPLIYLQWVARWQATHTMGGAYFRAPVAKRRAIVETLHRHARIFLPIFAVLNRVRRIDGLATAPYRGVPCPLAPSGRQLFERAARYRPDGGDVFVATQMKCGTTWMQQLVYEVLMRGRGDLSDTGHRHIQAVSPWIEGRISFPLEEAMRLGPRRQRIVKTHLPASICPYAEDARYIYVVRHPVACFRSCVDFLQMLMGPAAPSRAGLLDWFCSERMWWGPWPDHVESWWRRAEGAANVLFLHYEEMLEDAGSAVDRVSGFLEVPLDGDQRRAVVQKTSFDYMKAHEYWFEMSPPSVFSVTDDRRFFQSGDRERERGGDDGERERIIAFCRERMRGGRYPAGRFYPDLSG